MQTSVVATLAHRLWATTIVLGALTVGPNVALADEGGVSFWIPGLFGSLAAAPLQPGWSLASIYFHESVSAGGDVAAARQAAIGRFAPTVNVNLNATIAARPDLIFVSPSYTFSSPVLGGQLAVGVGEGLATVKPISPER